MRELLSAIKAAHDERNHLLDIKNHGGYYTWDALSDEGYQNYSRARYLIAKRKFIYSILKRLRYI